MTRINDGLTAKQRYAKKKHENAEVILCKCGCGGELKAFDKYGRVATYINGHNGKIKEDGTNLTNWEREKRWRIKNPEKLKEAKARFYKKRKLLALAYKGNKCVFCGLECKDGNSSVFDFHHSDPEFKESNISKMLINKAWKKVLAELDKCVIACANCHRLQHNKED